METLYKTYETCAGASQFARTPLLPVSHTTQQAHIEITIDISGVFRRATVVTKGDETTIVPCTEASGGRSGTKPVHHPLCDKLQYIAADFLDFGGKVTSGFATDPRAPNRNYVESLRAWAESPHRHPKVQAIWSYVTSGKPAGDLVRAGVLPVDARGKFLKQWEREDDPAPDIFRIIPKTQVPEDAFIRWRVEGAHNVASGTWEDQELIDAWTAYCASEQSTAGLCLVTGNHVALAQQHPAKLRHPADKAKLISSNDTSGFTFRGRFVDDTEACGVGFEVTQKAHNALRWLIERQGFRNAEQRVVAWAVAGKAVPDPMANSAALFSVVATTAEKHVEAGDVGQAFAVRLTKALAGYRARLDPSDDIVVLVLDSATPGRLAITYHRELKASEFLDRIRSWHEQGAWPQNLGKDKRFTGVPAPHEIADAAYGSRIDDKLRKATVDRLLRCIIEGLPIPRDLVESVARRARNRVGLKWWEWEKCLGIACSLIRRYYEERGYKMSLEQDRTDRDYLFGRLLAIADHVEARALYIAKEADRDTSATRLMQRFADHPSATWRTIELALSPYKSRLRANRPAFLWKMDKLMDDVIAAFEGEDFTAARPLSSEFLLGFHCQRQALRPNGGLDDDSSNRHVLKGDDHADAD